MATGSENLDPTQYSREVLQLKVAHINGPDAHNRDYTIAQIEGVLRAKEGDPRADSEGISRFYTGWTAADVRELLHALKTTPIQKREEKKAPQPSAERELDHTVYSAEVLRLKVIHINDQDDDRRAEVIWQIQEVLRARAGVKNADPEGISRHYTGWTDANIRELLEALGEDA